MAKKDKKIKISFVDSFYAQEVTGSNVYVETPNAIDGFHSLECVLPDYEVRNVQGYSVQKQKEILDTIKAHAAKIQVVFDKEDEHDAVIAEQAYNEYLKDGKKSRPITELWSELDI